MSIISEVLNTGELSDEALRELARKFHPSLQEVTPYAESPQEYANNWMAKLKDLMAKIRGITTPYVNTEEVLSGTLGLQLPDGINPVHAALSDPKSPEPRLLKDGFEKAASVFGMAVTEFGNLIPEHPRGLLVRIHERHMNTLFLSSGAFLDEAHILVEGVRTAREDPEWKRKIVYARPIMRAIVDPWLVGRA